MGAVLAFFPGWIKRGVVSVLGILAIVWGFAEYNQSIGKREVLADSRQAGKVNAKKSETHHANARRSGAAGRVLKEFCRDC